MALLFGRGDRTRFYRHLHDKVADFAAQKRRDWKVLGIAPENKHITDIYAIIEWQGHKFGAPLAQLKPIKSSQKIMQAIEDWRYYMDLD